jgi:hypothetical protein
MKAERVITERDLPRPDAGRVVAMFAVLERGRLAVFVNTRLIDEPAAVPWAERKASAGQLADFWLEGDEQVA